MKISATIIVRNEEHNIAAVCETVSWADEIIIVDSDSTDKTVEIARRYTDKVYNRPFRGYKDKHEYADSLTSGDWIFWIDADEIVTPELLESIIKVKNADPATLPDGYWIPRRTRYLGRWIRHSGWYPDYQMRFYKKSASYWDGVAPHQTARVHGRTEKLKGEFLHYTKRDLREYNRVLEDYASIGAEFRYQNGKRVRAIELLLAPIGSFLEKYIWKQGFRDGVQGLIIAIMIAYSVFFRLAKIWEYENFDVETQSLKKDKIKHEDHKVAKT